MKKFKKIASLLLALVMVCAMSVTAFADEPTYSITISNTTVEESYYAYQIFEATYVSTYTQGDTTGIAYTIDSSSAWYQAVVDSQLFDLTETSTTGTYVVVAKSATTATDIATWAAAAVKNTTYNITASAGSDKNGTGGELKLTVPSAGYYYVSSSLGSTVTLTSAAPSATIIDKNQEPGGDLTKTASDTEAQIGDSVTYTITSSVPAYDGETKITEYKFTDTLSSGLTAPTSVKVEIKNSTGTVMATNDITNTAYSDEISVSISGNVITVTFDPSKINSYPADATITITYTATVNAQAAYENGNSVTQTWTDNSTGETTEETVYTYGFKLVKVIKGTENELDGAKFKLYTSSTGGTAITFSYNSSTGTYTVDPNGTLTEIEVGSAYIFGLDADVTYYLEETQAPAGYNALTERQSVTISASGTTENEGVVTISQTEKVENGAGSTLPSTGGIGTTIFYVVGTIMVLGAVVVLITRKRMSAQ